MDDSFDFVIVGSGAGSMCAALGPAMTLAFIAAKHAAHADNLAEAAA